MAAIKPSPTGAVLALVAELRAAGRDIISLGTGEPDFDTPQHIKDAAQKAIISGKTKYTPTDGTAELKAAVQAKLSRENQLDYELSQIIVSSGAKQCLFNLCMGLLGPGDEAIIPAPYWVSYPDMARLAGAEPVIVSAGIEENFKISPAQLKAAITDDSRLLFLNSPGNPTGASYSRSELQALGAILNEHPKIVIAADDIYEHIHWGSEPFCSFATACPELYDRTVTTNGVSKAYAMTGWRIGYAAGPTELITAMKTIQSQSKCRRGEGTFYAFPRIDGVLQRMDLASDTDLVELLINEADVACVPGTAFGAPGYIRLSFACSMEMLEEAINRIKRVLMA